MIAYRCSSGSDQRSDRLPSRLFSRLVRKKIAMSSLSASEMVVSSLCLVKRVRADLAFSSKSSRFTPTLAAKGRIGQFCEILVTQRVQGPASLLGRLGAPGTAYNVGNSSGTALCKTCTVARSASSLICHTSQLVHYCFRCSY